MSNDSQLELKLANSNSGSCRTTQSTILVVFSVEKVFFRSVLMMKPHRACTRDSLLSVLLVLSN